MIKRIFSLFILLAATLTLLNSCLPLLLNDNEELYGSEWSDPKEQEGVKFLKSDDMLFFNGSVRATTKFEYYNSTGELRLDEIPVNYPDVTVVITGGLVKENTLYLYWHKLGKSESYYATYEKSR